LYECMQYKNPLITNILGWLIWISVSGGKYNSGQKG